MAPAAPSSSLQARALQAQRRGRARIIRLAVAPLPPPVAADTLRQQRINEIQAYIHEELLADKDTFFHDKRFWNVSINVTHKIVDI